MRLGAHPKLVLKVPPGSCQEYKRASLCSRPRLKAATSVVKLHWKRKLSILPACIAVCALNNGVLLNLNVFPRNTSCVFGFWSLFSKLSSHCIWTCCRPTWPTTAPTILFLLAARPKIQQTVIFLLLAVVWHLHFICSLEQFVSRSRPVSYTHHCSQW